MTNSTPLEELTATYWITRTVHRKAYILAVSGYNQIDRSVAGKFTHD